jgi:hypothetical protein
MTALGATLRRWAGVSFVAALLPSLIGGLFFPTAKLSFVERPITTAFMVGLAIAVAYAAYATRKWLRDEPAKKQQRLPEKTPIERSRRQQDLFAFLADNQPSDGP